MPSRKRNGRQSHLPGSSIGRDSRVLPQFSPEWHFQQGRVCPVPCTTQWCHPTAPIWGRYQGRSWKIQFYSKDWHGKAKKRRESEGIYCIYPAYLNLPDGGHSGPEEMLPSSGFRLGCGVWKLGRQLLHLTQSSLGASQRPSLVGTPLKKSFSEKWPRHRAWPGCITFTLWFLVFTRHCSNNSRNKS